MRRKIEAIELIRLHGSYAGVRLEPTSAALILSEYNDFPELEGVFTEFPFLEEQNEMSCDFLLIHDSVGDFGIVGPLGGGDVLRSIQGWRDALVGKDIFDRSALACARQVVRHGYTGVTAAAFGLLECALFDLQSRALCVPAYALLGGQYSGKIKCYGSFLGVPTGDLAKVGSVAGRSSQVGFWGQKWALRADPTLGETAILQNVALAKCLVDVLPERSILMFDALGRWDVSFSRRMMDALTPFGILFIEEPLHPNQKMAYRKMQEWKAMAIARGEHLYSPNEFLDALPLDFAQPDVGWCGGLRDSLTIANICSIFGIPVLPHGASLVPALHLAAACGESVIPSVEFHVTLETRRQYFFKEKFFPTNGEIVLSENSGFGIDIDWNRVSKKQILGDPV